MKRQISSNSATFTPQSYKTFSGALIAFFEQECPQLCGFKTRQVLVQSINDMVMKFYPKTNHLRPGQITWPTVHKDEKGAYGKSMKNTRLTNVILDLVQQQDAADRADGKKLRDIKKEATGRLCRQAFEQDGCMTNAEIANKLFIEQKTVQQVSRETYHSVRSIERYIVAFKQILLCRQKGMNTEEIAFSVRKTVRLVKEYEKIIDGYIDNNYIIGALLNLEVGIESAFEKIVASMP